MMFLYHREGKVEILGFLIFGRYMLMALMILGRHSSICEIKDF